MGARWKIGTIALLALATAVASARAGEEPEPIRVRLVAPQGCADEAAFLRTLRQRTGRLRLAGDKEPARLFRVTVTPGPSLVTGRLEIHGSGPVVSLRSVTGKTCDGVLAALAFMTALAVAPGAPSAASSIPVAPSMPSPAASSAASDSAAGAAIRAPRPSTFEAPASPRPASPVTGPPEPAPPVVAVVSRTGGPERWQWSAGAHGGGSLRISPTMGWGGLLFIEAAAPGTSWSGPVLRAGLFLNQSDVGLASGAEARFRWAAALLEGCPLRLYALRARLGLHSCLAFHVGALRGQGQHLDRPEGTTDLWADVGPVARLRVAVATRLFLEAQGMLVLPLRRLTYDVHDAGADRPPSTMFSVPRVGALVGIGVAYRFK